MKVWIFKGEFDNEEKIFSTANLAYNHAKEYISILVADEDKNNYLTEALNELANSYLDCADEFGADALCYVYSKKVTTE